uniref:RING-type domain-containing protein n=1 Tax=Terrapene triunguis TaxID=2587831 RepID=A0A674IZA0_9SAUR
FCQHCCICTADLLAERCQSGVWDFSWARAEPRGILPSSMVQHCALSQVHYGLFSPSAEASGIGHGYDRVPCISGTAPNSPVSMPESPISPSGSGIWGDECTICYENMVDTVIYSCGHMCLCYPCGLKLKKMANACCPICRRAIKDIIKTYRST